jgi:hypothetical protein
LASAGLVDLALAASSPRKRSGPVRTARSTPSVWPSGQHWQSALGSPKVSDGIRLHRQTARTQLTFPVRLRPRHRVARPASYPRRQGRVPHPQELRLQERFGAPRARGAPRLRPMGARRSGRSTEGRPDP